MRLLSCANLSNNDMARISCAAEHPPEGSSLQQPFDAGPELTCRGQFKATLEYILTTRVPASF
jgi:hypothetical protein